MAQVLELSDLDVLHQVDHGADRVRVDPAQHHARGVGRARGHGLAAGHRRRRANTGDQPYVVENAAPVIEATRPLAVDPDVGVVAEDLALQIGAEAAHDRDHGAQRERAHADAGDREHADHGQEAALVRAHVARRHERDEAATFHAVERPGHRQRHRADHEEDAAQHRAHAHDLVPEHEVIAPRLRQTESPATETDQRDEEQAGHADGQAAAPALAEALQTARHEPTDEQHQPDDDGDAPVGAERFPDSERHGRGLGLDLDPGRLRHRLARSPSGQSSGRSRGKAITSRIEA